MTIAETYPIHRCIFRNDTEALKELLKDEKMQKSINEYDNHGNTPLHLALMLNRHNCTMILLQYDCDVLTRNFFGWNPMDESSIIGDIDVIEKISYFKFKDYFDVVTKPGGLMDQWDETTPNLELKVKLKIKTTIPLLQKFGLKDIQHLHKKGKNVRLDTTLGGVDTRGTIPKINRSKISVLFKYNEETKKHTVYLVDHKKKLYQEFFPNIPEWYLTNSLKSKVAANCLYKFFLDLTKFNLKAVKGNILKKTSKTFTMEDGKTYKCSKFRGKNISIIARKRHDEGIIGECESIIKTDVKEEDPKAKKAREEKFRKNSSLVSRNNNSKTSADSDDESDSDFEDSDDNSDIEEKSINSNAEMPKFINNLYNGDKDKKNVNSTVQYTVNKDGKTETFEKVTEVEDTLDWEEAYREKYAQNSDLMYAFISGKKDNTKIKRLNHAEIEALHLQKISEEDYFDPSSTDHLHLGRIMNITDERKSYNHKIKFWMAKESSGFPISAYDVKPLFDYIAMILLDQIRCNDSAGDLDRQAYEYITQTLMKIVQDKKSFPVKTSIPLYPSVAFQITFLNVSRDTKYLPDDLYEIPSDYKVGNVFFEHVSK